MEKYKKRAYVLTGLCLILAALLFCAPLSAQAAASVSKTSVVLYLGQEGKDTCALSVSGVPSGGTVSFSSGNEAVASVSADGVIRAVSPGKTTVVCTVTGRDGKTAQLKTAVRVYDNIKSITLTLKDGTVNALRKNTEYQLSYTCKTAAGTNKNIGNYIYYEVLTPKGAVSVNASVDENGVFTAKRCASYVVQAYAFQSSSRYKKWAADREKYASYVLAQDSLNLTVTPGQYSTQTNEIGGFCVVLPKSYTLEIQSETKNRTFFSAHVKNSGNSSAVSNIQVIIDKVDEAQSYELLSAVMSAVYTKGALEQSWKLAYNAGRATVKNLKIQKLEADGREIMKISYALSLRNIVLEMKEAADIKISRMDFVNTIYTWYDGKYHISVTVTDALEGLQPNISDAAENMVLQFSK